MGAEVPESTALVHILDPAFASCDPRRGARPHPAVTHGEAAIPMSSGSLLTKAWKTAVPTPRRAVTRVYICTLKSSGPGTPVPPNASHQDLAIKTLQNANVVFKPISFKRLWGRIN